ncbi:MAG: M28 family peptidase, partial [Eggerthellaceae bacterium]|nr:M28 family peptidase [Eggerthellaceae bacterium]
NLLGKLPSVAFAAGAPDAQAQAQAQARPDLKTMLPSLSGGATESEHEEWLAGGGEDPTGGYAQDFSGGYAGNVIGSSDDYPEDYDEGTGDQSLEEAGRATGFSVGAIASRAQKLFGRIGFGKAKAGAGVESGYNQEDDDRDWQGGAFSTGRAGFGGDPEDGLYDEAGFQTAGFAAVSGRIQGLSTGEMQQVAQFRHPQLDTEIWFVALGSELANCGGMRAFLSEHGQDLRGSVIINMRALGAGELSYIEQEGTSGSEIASSRMKRYVKKAGQLLGTDVETASLLWMNSAATVASKKGYQAVSIAGMQGSKPARFAQRDDVLENIDEATLARNVDFVMELLKNI